MSDMSENERTIRGALRMLRTVGRDGLAHEVASLADGALSAILKEVERLKGLGLDAVDREAYAAQKAREAQREADIPPALRRAAQGAVHCAWVRDPARPETDLPCQCPTCHRVARILLAERQRCALRYCESKTSSMPKSVRDEWTTRKMAELLEVFNAD